ncbi:MAG: hypothetical protein VX012_04295, partial [Planctomycetota bacterium]|nr:hypothetical protein [Planctomycetota bacterium]
MSQLTAPQPTASNQHAASTGSGPDAGSDSGGRKLERQLVLALLGGTLLLVGGAAKLIDMPDAVSNIPA